MLDLIWNEWCGLPCLSRPCVVIFISLSQTFHLFVYTSLRYYFAAFSLNERPVRICPTQNSAILCRTFEEMCHIQLLSHFYTLQDVWKMQTSFCFLYINNNKHFCTTLVENRSCLLIWMKLEKLLKTGRMTYDTSDGVILPHTHLLHHLPTENMKHRREDWSNWNERKRAEPWLLLMLYHCIPFNQQHKWHD